MLEVFNSRDTGFQQRLEEFLQKKKTGELKYIGKITYDTEVKRNYDAAEDAAESADQSSEPKTESKITDSNNVKLESSDPPNTNSDSQGSGVEGNNEEPRQNLNDFQGNPNSDDQETPEAEVTNNQSKGLTEYHAFRRIKALSIAAILNVLGYPKDHINKLFVASGYKVHKLLNKKPTKIPKTDDLLPLLNNLKVKDAERFNLYESLESMFLYAEWKRRLLLKNDKEIFNRTLILGDVIKCCIQTKITIVTIEPKTYQFKLDIECLAFEAEFDTETYLWNEIRDMSV
uniref:Uncharacterized protein n=1 Tax=Aplanochytrium stocchinoi TaxID=215587 RepID=A0A7S3LQC0_9STRA|mmetsp:Transcript_11600/g.15129  ORF Transcript_11600/g.15129 Transcript_11600/m.15129 type:complete len:287 (-) Transcript_11600:234-1094(-)|eukprot:CAMPEP_0204865792 /NCGR_PEP_ID=MMETSP1348-20121228/13667_1 /ASSEMBLY_ACC=CAM_ASM_000700 /TAXON_ID=215587 /ORGANISM="Aplanochytrium stocchinoi, Strain GSBS06" /LENGTH=286 /DNA_ID=CAMNT_0052017327 /DNA_START=517 /DNA_END=1377 /DNA_ORIENTATION=-